MDPEKPPLLTSSHDTPTSSPNNADSQATTASSQPPKPCLAKHRLTLGQFTWYTVVATSFALIKNADPIIKDQPDAYALFIVNLLTFLALLVAIKHLNHPMHPDPSLRRLSHIEDMGNMGNTIMVSWSAFVALTFFTPWVGSWALEREDSATPRYATCPSPQATFTPRQAFALSFTFTWFITSEATYWYTRLIWPSLLTASTPFYPEIFTIAGARNVISWYARLFPHEHFARPIAFSMALLVANLLTAVPLFWCIRRALNPDCYLPMQMLGMGLDMMFLSPTYLAWGMSVNWVLARPVRILHGAVFEWAVEQGVQWVERRRGVEDKREEDGLEV